MPHFTGLLAHAWEHPLDVSPGAPSPARKLLEQGSRTTLLAGSKALVLLSLDMDRARGYRRWHCSASGADRSRPLRPEQVEPLLALCRTELGSAGWLGSKPVRIEAGELPAALAEAAEVCDQNPDREVELVTLRAVHILRPLTLEEHTALLGRLMAERS